MFNFPVAKILPFSESFTGKRKIQHICYLCTFYLSYKCNNQLIT